MNKVKALDFQIWWEIDSYPPLRALFWLDITILFKGTKEAMQAYNVNLRLQYPGLSLLGTG